MRWVHTTVDRMVDWWNGWYIQWLMQWLMKYFAQKVFFNIPLLNRSTHLLTIIPYTRPTDHDLDNLYPSLPLWDVVRDLYSADPTKETCARLCRTCVSHPENMRWIMQLRNPSAPEWNIWIVKVGIGYNLSMCALPCRSSRRASSRSPQRRRGRSSWWAP